MIAAADVRAALAPDRVLDEYGVRYRRRGDELRMRMCPACGQRSRDDAVSVNAATGVWRCHAHGCKGDIFALVAGYAGLDITRGDYPRVIERAAEIAGVTGSFSGIVSTPRRTPPAPSIDWAVRWTALVQRSSVGERYLADRGIDPIALRDRGDIVRYSPNGEIAVAMRSLETGAIAGIQYRAAGDKGFRCEAGSRPSTAALGGRVAELDRDGVDVAVLVEGLADTLAACLAWPSCAIYGAAGAEHLATIAATVAPRVRSVRGWLLVVTDDDDTGIQCANDALDAAEAAGLRLDRDLRLVEIGAHHDLADAWAAGWRWRWPEDERDRGGAP